MKMYEIPMAPDGWPMGLNSKADKPSEPPFRKKRPSFCTGVPGAGLHRVRQTLWCLLQPCRLLPSGSCSWMVRALFSGPVGLSIF